MCLRVDQQGDAVTTLPSQHVAKVRAAIERVVNGDAYRLVDAY
jgi:hypothetical protein